jgi:hypothetical protein
VPEECRDFAHWMTDPEFRDQLLDMAKIWDGIATDRRALAQQNQHAD